LLCLSFLCALCASARATVYYVDVTNGNNSWSGTNATIVNDPPLETVPFTYCAWVRQTNVATKYQSYIGGSTGGIQWYVNPTPSVMAISTEAGSQVGNNSTYAVNEGNATWTHVALTYDGTYLNFYTNAVNIGTSTTSSTTFTSSATSSIGYDEHYSANYFNGDIRLISVYNRILSGGELTNIYQLGLMANMSGVIGQ
jgi:hypothetical protein